MAKDYGDGTGGFSGFSFKDETSTVASGGAHVAGKKMTGTYPNEVEETDSVDKPITNPSSSLVQYANSGGQAYFTGDHVDSVKLTVQHGAAGSLQTTTKTVTAEPTKKLTAVEFVTKQNADGSNFRIEATTHQANQDS